MESQTEAKSEAKSDPPVVSKQELDEMIPEEINGGIITATNIEIKKEPREEETNTTEVNQSTMDFENFIGNNDPINIKSEDVNTIIDTDEKETYQHMMIGAGISLEDEVEKKPQLNLKGEVIDMELGDVKDEPAEESSESSSSEEDSSEESIKNTAFNNATNSAVTYTKKKKPKIMFRCHSCKYRSSRESRMIKHQLVHLSPSQVFMYRCEACNFQTKYEESLKHHIVVMHNPEPKKVYKCDRCTFQTTFLSAFKVHVDSKVHELVKEQGLFKCPQCSYKTKVRGKIPQHMTVHKKPSETTMYDCEVCPYRSKWRHCLRNHLKAHKNKKEKVPVHKCERCEYTTDNRYSLATHGKKHMDGCKKKFKCPICSYRIDKQYRLKKHMEKHKDRSEREVFSCDYCGFDTIERRSLEIHYLMKHQDKKQ